MDALTGLIKELVSLGLSPLDIALVVFCILLYRKTEQLDRLYHDCLSRVNMQGEIKTDSQ